MRLALFGVVGLLAPVCLFGCGGSSSCSKACKHVAACDPNATCSLSAQCTTAEKCQATCITAATCDAITGKDPVAAANLASCIKACGSAPAGDGPKIWLDSGTDAPTCSCAGRQCGTDGCGNSCGTCGAGLTCNTVTGQCESGCTPSCAGRQCGSDGCGGSCGTCSGGLTCNTSTGQCESGCTPDCYNKNCGSDGCGGSCGTCSGGTTCDTSTGQCVGSSGTNSGAICNASQLCSGGDQCLYFDASATNGMCLAACSNPGDTCPAGSGMYSICGVDANSQQSFCVYICKIQTTTYPCPNSYDYTCKVIDPTYAPDIGACVPN